MVEGGPCHIQLNCFQWGSGGLGDLLHIHLHSHLNCVLVVRGIPVFYVEDKKCGYSGSVPIKCG